MEKIKADFQEKGDLGLVAEVRCSVLIIYVTYTKYGCVM